MLTTVQQIFSVEDLRDYVNETLCEHFHLQLDAFEMTQRILRRSDRPCGIYFCLHGPRRVRFTAIWETDRNCILFYGPTGERFLKTQLIDAPVLEPIESRPLEQVVA
ncbi:MAG: hypothetical protein HQ582_21415 [Planctomycetes bacterium]|nr:hypothetical protein [Planctomycetota bacterium]